jgi:putative peptidoglycan lipid II flippase
VHWVLAAYAVGLVSFGSVKLLSSAYYAMQDYRTPLRASLVSIFVSAIVSVSIAIPLRSWTAAAAGVALGSALGSYVNLSLLIRGLRRQVGVLYTPMMWTGTRRIVIAAAVAALATTLLRLGQQYWFPSIHPRIAGVPVLAAFGLTYLSVAWWMGSAEAARWLRRPVRAVTP